MSKVPDKCIYVILLVFAILNIKAASWRLTEDHPTPYFEDEGTTLTLLANLNLKRGDFRPHFLGNPTFYYLMVGGTTYLYNKFEQFVGFDIGKIRSELPKHKNIGYSENHYVGLKAVYIGRILTLLFALGTIFLIYRIGMEFCSQLAGLLAALVYSVSSAVVWTSHYATPNHAATFFITVSLYFTLKYLISPIKKWLVVASIFAGIALSTKYTTIAMIAVLFATIFLKNWHISKKTLVKDLGTSCLSVILSSFITCPFMYIYLPEFIKSFNWVKGQVGLTKWYYLDFPGTFYGYIDTIGASIMFLFAISLLISVSRRIKQDVVFYVFVVVFYIVTLKMAGALSEERMLPVIVFMALIIGNAMDYALNRLDARRYLRGVVVTTLILFFVFDGAYAYSINSYYYYGSVQNRVSKYIEEKIPYGSRIAILHNNDRFCDPGIVLKHMDKGANQKLKDEHALLLKDLTDVSGHWRLKNPSYKISKLNFAGDIGSYDYLVISTYDSVVAGEDVRKINYLKYRYGNHLNDGYYRDYDDDILIKRRELLSNIRESANLDKVAVISGSYNPSSDFFMNVKKPDYAMFFYGPFTIYKVSKK